MGISFSIDSNVNRLRKSNGRFLAGIPDMEDDVADKFAEKMEENIKQSVEKKFDRFDGDLKNNVDASPGKSTGDGKLYKVTANAYSSNGVNYAAWHEFAKQSHVAPVRGDLKRWAADKGILDDIGTGLEVTPMNQREGSFMEPAIQKTIAEQRRDLRSGRNDVSEALKKNFG